VEGSWSSQGVDEGEAPMLCGDGSPCQDFRVLGNFRLTFFAKQSQDRPPFLGSPAAESERPIGYRRPTPRNQRMGGPKSTNGESSVAPTAARATGAGTPLASDRACAGAFAVRPPPALEEAARSAGPRTRSRRGRGAPRTASGAARKEGVEPRCARTAGASGRARERRPPPRAWSSRSPRCPSGRRADASAPGLRRSRPPPRR
jgi:hypothetical protein